MIFLITISLSLDIRKKGPVIPIACLSGNSFKTFFTFNSNFFSSNRFKIQADVFMIPTFVTLCMSGLLFLVLVEDDVELFDRLK